LETRPVLAAPQLGCDIRRRNSGGGPHHQQMIEQIGAFADKSRPVVADTFYYGFNCFLAELLSDLCPAASKEPSGVRDRRIGATA
jgi:hypothetical protein